MNSFSYYFLIISLIFCIFSCSPYHYDFYTLDDYPSEQWTKIHVKGTAYTTDSSDFHFKPLPTIQNNFGKQFNLSSDWVINEFLLMKTLDSLLSKLPPIVNEKINHKKIKRQLMNSTNHNQYLEYDDWFYYDKSKLGLHLRVEPIYLYDTERLLGVERIVNYKRIGFSLPFISFNRNKVKEYDEHEYIGNFAFKISVGVRYNEKKIPPIYAISPSCGELTYRLMWEQW